MTRTRRPTDAERSERHRELVAQVEDELLEEGYTEEFIELLAEALLKHGAGEGLVAIQKARRAARVDELTKLFIREAELHDRLHALFGRLGRAPLQASPPSLGARSVRAEWQEAPSCKSRMVCSSPAPAVRGHADFVRWLGEMVKEAKVTPLGDVESVLASRGAIVAFLRREPALSYEAIAAFVLVRSEGRRLPLDEPLLAKTAKNLRQTLIDKKKSQK